MIDLLRIPTVSAIGVLSWDELIVLDRYPQEGECSLVQRTMSAPGGTTGNMAMAARRLGASVSLLARVGSDQLGATILQSLCAAGIDTTGCLIADGATDVSTMLVSEHSAERTILWKRGTHIQRRDRIDIDALFGADVTIIDCTDHALRTFLTDLPAHTRPSARLIGTLTYLADVVADNKMEVALRHDILIGNEREYRALVGLDDALECLQSVGSAMTGHNLRTAVMTSGSRGAHAISNGVLSVVPALPVAALDTTGAGDAFVGAFAYAVAARWTVEQALIFANAVASCVVTSLGAQTGLPTYEDALMMAGLDA